MSEPRRKQCDRPRSCCSPLGVVIALAVLALGVGVIFDRTGGKYWFYWIAPLLMLGLGGDADRAAVGY